MQVSTPSTLPEYIALFSVSSVVKKPLFGGPQVASLPFLLQGLFVFGEGMILGRRYRHRLHVLADTMIGSLTMGETFRRLGLPVETANDSQAILACVSKIAGDAVRYYGRAPDTMLDFLLTALSPPDLDIRDVKRLQKLRSQSVPLDGVLYQGGSWFVAGVSVGAYLPDDAVDRLLHNVYGQPDPLWWAELHRSGCYVPDQETFSSELFEQMASSLLAVYAKEHHPELLQPLGIQQPEAEQHGLKREPEVASVPEATVVGFRMNRLFPLAGPVYCINCISDVAAEKSWTLKAGDDRMGVAPLVRFNQGVVRYLRVPMANQFSRDRSGDWPIDDVEWNADYDLALMVKLRIPLGLRVIPSLPEPEPKARCKVCKVNLVDVRGRALSPGSSYRS